MNRHIVLFCIASTLPFWIASANGQIVETDPHGRIQAMVFDGDPIAIKTDIRIPDSRWSRSPGLGSARDVEISRSAGRCETRGRIELEPGKSCRFVQIVQEQDAAVQISLEIAALADMDTAGVFFWLDVPIEEFSGGSCELTDQDGPVRQAVLPAELPEEYHFLSGRTRQMVLRDAAGNLTLWARWDQALPTTIQDNRKWQANSYSAYPTLHRGPLVRDQRVSFQATLQLDGRPDRRPAVLTLQAEKVRYRLDGFGGNYCFQIESPVTQYTLENLRVAWARTEMTLRQWEPENDNDSPTETDWDALRRRDRPDSELRREFLLAQKLQERRIPYCISIWHLPEWLYADPNRDRREHGRRVAPDRWPELLECIGSYLVYARDQYGVEPNLFSFNEANIGVYVYFSAEEHRDALKRIGAHLRKLGLSTKMLLADATGPRGTHTYAQPAAADPEALQYVGAVGFHSWGGANPEQYGAWGDLAERLRLPLLVTELGVDAQAWQTRSYSTFYYALREVRMYQEILLYARPQGTMQWEFTADYSLVEQERRSADSNRLVPTERFWFVKHFCNLTPAAAEALETRSDHPKVLFTAFAGRHNGRRILTCHIANLAAEREATLTGLPADLSCLQQVRTGKGQPYQILPPLPVDNGGMKLHLPAQSLLTLTSLPVESP
ncbi:MAG: hypothetical protein JW810_00930 [Sedimentisphaerales bacterium]|nr:hypothetical protein [Sedimentisphaerales bacterium]